MPSSPSLAGGPATDTPTVIWQSLDGTMVGPSANRVPTAPFALPAFESSLPTSPTVQAFSIDRSAGIPPELLAAETATARASGYANGYALGLDEARVAAAAHLARRVAADENAAAARDAATEQAFEGLFDAAEELESRVVTAAADIEGQIVAAAWQIAAAIVGQVLADTETRSQAAVSRALSLAPTDCDVVVSVCPDDFVALGGDPATLAPLKRERGLRAVTITADDSLTPGDAMAKTGATVIDARLGAAIERVRQVLMP